MVNTDRQRLPASVKQTGGKRPFAEPGTALANISSLESEGFTRQSTSWGGARNRRDRTSWHLTRKQCEELIEATDFAVQLGLGFNRHWIVHHERAGVSGIDAPAFITHLLKLVREYATRKKGQFTAVWIREDGEGKGGHVHILMHVPAACQLRGRSRYWIRLAAGTYRKKVSRVRSIGGWLGASVTGCEHYQHNLAEVLGYVLKCASTQTGEALALPRHGEGGLVIGKRCGFTQNIGPTARHRAGAI